MASSSSYIIIALLLAAVFSISGPAAYAEDGMVQHTSGGTLDIKLEPTWSDGGQAKFKVTFLDPKTGAVHQHQDYDFRILKGDTEVFSTSKQTGQPLIHNAEGTLTVPYTFTDQGDFKVQVYLAGTGISPTIPTNETADFSIKVTPEFPVGALVGITALMGMVVVLSRYRLHL